MRRITEARREAILAAAAEEFSRSGYEGASLAAIAARLGSSKPTLYRYFPSKEALFAAVTSRRIDELMESAEAALTGGPDLARGLRQYGERYLLFRQSPEAVTLIRVAFGESGQSEIGRLLWKGAKLRGIEKIGQILFGSMETGFLRRAEPKVAAAHLFALLEAELVDAVVLRVRQPADGAEITEIVDRAVDAFLRAYSAEGAFTGGPGRSAAGGRRP